MTTAVETQDRLVADPSYADPAPPEILERTADALRAQGFHVGIARDRDEARRMVLDLVPDGAETHHGASVTLSELGVTTELEESGRYAPLRPTLEAMDRQTQAREMRRLSAAPDVWLSSAHAVTEEGTIVIASKTGSQLGPLAYGAGKVVFAIGAQKIVKDLATAVRRIERYSYPLEDARSREAYGAPSAINKLLVIRGDATPERISVVLIREAIGF